MNREETNSSTIELPSIARSLPIALLRAREKVMAPFREMLSRTDITEQQWRVLRILSEFGPQDSTLHWTINRRPDYQAEVVEGIAASAPSSSSVRLMIAAPTRSPVTFRAVAPIPTNASIAMSNATVSIGRPT